MADRYWVGGTGSWSDATNHWSTTSGGAPGAGNLPTATDDVIFDTLSNATAYTCTIDATTKLCRDITFGAPLVGNMTWAGSVAMTISGSMTLYSGLIRTYTGTITFNATSGTKIITSAGISLASNIILNGSGGTFQLADSLTTTGNITNTAGTFDATTNTTTVTLNGTAQTITPTAALTFYSLTRTGTATKTDTFTIAGNITVSNTFTVTGGSAINRLLVQSNTKGTARTITAAVVSVDKVDFQDITGAGAASWDMSAAAGYTGDCGGNSMKALGSAAFTTAATQTATGTASFTWSTHGWTSRIPLPQDDVVIDNSFVAGRTITVDMPRIGKSIDCSGATGSPIFANTVAISFFGSFAFATGMTTNQTSGIDAEGRGSYTFTSAGVTLFGTFTVNNVTGTLTLQDALVTNTGRNLGLTSGNLNANNQNVTIGGVWSSNNSNTRSLTMGSGTWTISGTGTVWSNNTSTGMTLTQGTSTIKLTNTTATARTFAGGGKTYNNLWHAGGAGGATLTITGSNTFADFKDDGSVAHSILFTAGTTQTVATFTVNGTAGQEITINSTTTATHALVKSGGGTISCDYLNIQHSVATPGSTWYANNSTNNQAVATAGSGWTFTAPPGGISTGGLLMFF